MFHLYVVATAVVLAIGGHWRFGAGLLLAGYLAWLLLGDMDRR